MDYIKQPWVDGETPLDAEHMSHIEDGIEAAHAVASEAVATAETATATAEVATMVASENAKAVVELSAGKLNKHFGAENAGAKLVVGNDGNVTTQIGTMDAKKNGEIVTISPVAGTTAKVVSKITGQDAGYKFANRLVLLQTKGKNVLDIVSILGGAGSVFEKDGLRAVVNADGTITYSGTNTSTATWNNLISVTVPVDDRMTYPAGTYTIAKNMSIQLYAPDSIGTTYIGSMKNTFTVNQPFWVNKVAASFGVGVSLNETVPLAFVADTSIPISDFQFEGIKYTALFSSAVTDGVFDWQTGALKDASGNLIETVTAFEEFPVFDGANTFTTGVGVSTVTYKIPDDGSGDTGSTAASDAYLLDAPLKKIDTSYMLLPVFHHVGCIGDSLASGESAYTDGDGQHFIDLYDHSWGQYLAKATGNTYYNFSRGGLAAKTWLETQATAAFDGTKKCEAYIIGLGHNDSNRGDPVGTSADINVSDHTQNADTFYGNYGKIIQMIKEHQPKAKIFVLTAVAEGVETGGYNAAVRTIAKMFSNVYLLDFYNYKGLHFSDGILAQQSRNGHYNAVGYKYISAMIGSYIDWYMYNYPEEFEQVEFIGTDYEWTD